MQTYLKIFIQTSDHTQYLGLHLRNFNFLSFVWSVSTSKLGPFWCTSAFPQLIFSSQICSPLPPLSEIKERVKDSLTKFRQDHLRALNPTPYKVRQIFLKQARVMKCENAWLAHVVQCRTAPREVEDSKIIEITGENVLPLLCHPQMVRHPSLLRKGR